MDIKKEFLSAKQALFDKYYGARLNPEQRRAVFSTEGPLLVLAGAGSGKTTVLVNRIVYIIKYGNAYFDEELPEGVDEGTVAALRSALELSPSEIGDILPGFITSPCPPWAVLAITFTNKAAGEIRERLVKSLGDEIAARDIWAGTFHSICLRILRRYGDRLGYGEGFSIYDTDDQKRLITKCMQELEIDEKRLSPKVVQSSISQAKDKLIYHEDYEVTSDPRTRDIRAIYKLYSERLMQYNAMDFDDIIMRTVELLKTDEEVRSYYQRKFRYVLVDEYQDTNYAQFILTKLLSDGYRNIMVVGDDDQSIYKFRGATIENILNFDKTYEDATVIKLEQNYRSTATILDAANAVINHNTDRHQKKLWCDKGEGDKITLKEATSPDDEGRYILDKISAGVRVGGRKYSDYAVLYRVNALGRSLQTSFAKSGIPYKVLGDMRFYDRKEIKDMVAYLTLVTTPSDNLRLKRVINEPKRKIGTATVEAIEEIAVAESLPMYTVMARSGEYTALLKNQPKLTAFTDMLDKIRAERTLPSEIITAVFEDSGYRSMLVAEGFEGQGKIENVTELINGAVEYENRCRAEEIEPTAEGYLEEISLVTDVDKYDDTADAVVLMTIHAAKGLEFPVVFLAGMEDGIFPSQQNFGEPSEMSEERRLAYVAITRAKEKLYVTYARERMMYGKTNYGRLTRFVKEEIPQMLIEEDRPVRVPPRAQTVYTKPRRDIYDANLSEMRRSVNVTNSAPAPQRKKSGAAEYGIIRYKPGTRVTHAIFGDGTIVSSRDMGGDVLYEVRFDNGQTKKLMATFAKLREI